jgi:hypothetical protein
MLLISAWQRGQNRRWIISLASAGCLQTSQTQSPPESMNINVLPVAVQTGNVVSHPVQTPAVSGTSVPHLYKMSYMTFLGSLHSLIALIQYITLSIAVYGPVHPLEDVPKTSPTQYRYIPHPRSRDL